MNLSLFLPSEVTSTETISEFLEARDSQREFVFFDECVDCFVVVQSESEIKVDSDIFIETSVISGDTLDPDSTYTHQGYVISSEKLDEHQIIFNNSHSTSFFTVWKLSIPIKYPKKKLNSPTIKFSCYTKDKKKAVEPRSSSSLEDLVPQSRNLLQELNNQIRNDASQFYLSGDIIQSSASPIAEQEVTLNDDCEEPILASSLSLPIYSSLIIKLKSTKPAGQNNFLLASVNLECSESLLKLASLSYRIEVIKVDVGFTSGQISYVHDNVRFPMQMDLNESINLNYRLTDNDVSNTYLKQFDITILLRIIDKHNKYISNIITTNWSPYIDFNLVAPPISSSHKSLAKSSINLRKRNVASVPNLSQPKRLLTTSNLTVNLTSPSNINTTTTVLGLKLTFYGKLNVKMGQIARWKLQAINTSPNRLNLSLMIQNNPALPSPAAGPNTNSRIQTFNTYKSLKLDADGILLLENDIRLSLEPNSVYETTFKLVGMSKGIYNLDGLKLYDLNSGEGIDFGKLVEVFVT